MDSSSTQTSDDQQQTQLKIIFKGNTQDYFRIWIVNLLLTVVTLGIYSAWAKVRNRKYLYGNLELAGSRFDYHADPIKVLKGRLLVLLAFAFYAIIGKISIYLQIASMLSIFALMPWVIVRALIFSLSNTSYRNIRFGFAKAYKESYSYSLKAAATYMFSFGLLIPYSIYLMNSFVINNIRLGNSYFRFKPPTSSYYKIIYTSVAIFIISILTLFPLVKTLFDDKQKQIFATVLIFYFNFFLAFTIARARLINLRTSSTQINDVKFNSNLNPFGLLGIYITNIIVSVITLGLAIPWAQLRLLKYRIENTTILTGTNSFDNIISTLQEGDKNSVADAVTDFWDIDLGV